MAEQRRSRGERRRQARERPAAVSGKATGRAEPLQGARSVAPAAEIGPAGAWEQGWRRWLVLTLGLLLILAMLYPGPMFRGEIFASADAASAGAFQAIGDEAVAQRDYPQWNPYIFGGMPTFGSLSYPRFVYPPSVLVDFLQGTLGFPPATWLLAHLLLGGLGVAYLLGKWNVPLAGQLLGAAAFILMPRVTAWAVHGHGTKLITAMYWPWVLAWAWQILGGRGWTAVGVLGLVLGLQFLRGHVQITYYTLLTVGWLALVNLAWPLRAGGEPAPARRRWWRTGQLGTGLLLGFLVGAVLLVPVREYARISIRGEAAGAGGGAPYEYATGWSLGPGELPTLVLPSAAGFGKATYLGPMPFTDYPSYLGFLLLVLAGCAFAAPARRRLAVALGVLALGTLIVALGRHFPLHRMLYDWLPYFDKFRVPSMILAATGLAVIGLAAIGGHHLARPAAAPERWVAALAVSLGAVGLLLLLGGATGLAEPAHRASLSALAAASGKQAAPTVLDEAWHLHRSDLVRIGLLLATAASAVMLARRRPGFRRRGLLWVMAVLVIWDLAAVDRRIVHPEESLLERAADSQGRVHLVPAARMLRQYRSAAAVPEIPESLAAELRAATGHDRIWPLGGVAASNRFMTARLRSLSGYHPAKLAAFEQIRRLLESPEQPAGRVAAWLAGRTLVLDGPLPDQAFAVLDQFGFDLDPQPVVSDGVTAYHNRAALPRARLVTQWRLAETLPWGDDLEAFVTAIQRGRHDYADVVVLEQIPDPVPADAPPGTRLPQPEFVVDGLDEVVLAVDAPVPALLLLADMHAPGWRVLVDGVEVPLLRADLTLRAVALPAGPHEVRFEFADPSLAAGLSLSLLGLTGSLVALAAGWWRGRRRWMAVASGGPAGRASPADDGASRTGGEDDRG
ncbi:MAG: hypothetical protein R6X25_12980 [Candidatus Krumholzibacteriia bacterium]